MRGRRFIERVVLRNYKSIAACDVELPLVTFLVGQNGTGKSNFLDALRFVTDSLRNSLEYALRDRGGIGEVRRRSSGHPTHFGVRVEFRLDDGSTGHYAFSIGAKPKGAYEVQEEEALVRLADSSTYHYFRVQSGKVTKSTARVPPPAETDRLYLVNAAGLPEFKPLYDSLKQMGFYNLNPDRMRELQPPDAGDLLVRDGSNLSSVLSQIASTRENVKKQIEEYLSAVVPGIKRVEPKIIGPLETVEFRQDVAGAQHPWKFLAGNMSDGTLRALGILVALFQARDGSGRRVPLVGIEEPELALHPAAAGVLLDSLRDASRDTQIVVTSHSPDLLDDAEIDSESILAVILDAGVTKIGPLDDAGRSALRDHLYTAGELLRLDQLAPDSKSVASAAQLSLFSGMPANANHAQPRR